MVALAVLLAVTSSPATPAALPFDPGEVVRRVHFAFKPNADGFAVEHTTFRARARPDGTLAVAAAGAQSCLPAVEVGPAVVSRGRATVPLPRGSTVSEAGALERRGAGVVEGAEAGETGVELRWRFERAPNGNGDLVVRLPVDAPLVGLDDAGAHFGPAGTGVLVSHGTWVDAEGRRTPVAAVVRGRALEFRVPERLLATSRFPAVLDPLVSPEVTMGQGATLWPSMTTVNPMVASDGTGFLVAWQDYRGNENRAAIYGARVNAQGQNLDPLGFLIAGGIHDHSWQAVGYGGGVWLVAWRESDIDGIFARRYDANGAALDLIPIFVGSGYCSEPAVGFDGTDLVVAFMRSQGGNWDIAANRVSPATGLLLDGDGFVVCNSPGDQVAPAVACGGGQCLVTWDDSRGGLSGPIYAARLTGSTVLDANGFPVFTTTEARGQPAVAFGGGEFLVAFGGTEPDAGTPEILATRVTPAATVVDVPPLALAGPPDRQDTPKVAFDGTDFVVSWNAYSLGQGQLKRVSTAGVVLDPAPAVMSPSGQLEPTVAASANGTVLAVWRDERHYPKAIYTGRFDTALTALDDAGIPLLSMETSQWGPRVASDGTDYLIAWTDWRNNDPDVWAARVAADGRLLDPAGLGVGTGPGFQENPSLSFGGGSYLVAYTDDSLPASPVVARRVSPQGAVLDATPIVVSHAASGEAKTPSVAFDGTEFFVSWVDYRDPVDSPDIYGGRVSTGGQSLDVADIAVGLAPRGQYSPAVGVTDAGVTLVAWTHDDGSYTYNVHVARLSNGVSLDGPAGIRATPQDCGDCWDSRIACGGGACLLVFRWGWGDIVGVRFDDQGQPLQPTPLPIATAYGPQVGPAVAFDTDHWFVVWEDGSGGRKSQLRGTRVLLDGTVLNPEGIVLVDEPTDALEPSLATSAPGRLLLSYVRLDPASQASRVRAVQLFEVPQGGACAADGECQSLHCADGVCCDSACGAGAVDCLACSRAAGAPVDGTCSTLAAGKACRPPVGTCDVAETCDGTSVTCPADAFLQDGLVCSGDGQCASGICLGASSSGYGFTSGQASYLACRRSYHYSTSGGPTVAGPGPVSYELLPRPGETLPDGLSVDAATGELSWTPTPDQAGPHFVYLVARGSGWSAAQSLEIVVDCLKLTEKVGCGCTQLNGPLALAALALLLARRRRPAPRPR